MFQVSINTIVSCFDVGVSLSPRNKTIYSFLVHFFLFLAIETLNVNDNMIFKCVKLVQILSSVVLMWACLLCPAIRSFLHFLVHFLLLLAIEILNVNVQRWTSGSSCRAPLSVLVSSSSDITRDLLAFLLCPLNRSCLAGLLLLNRSLISDFLTDLPDHPGYSAACLEPQSPLAPCAQQLQRPACLPPSEVFAPL